MSIQLPTSAEINYLKKFGVSAIYLAKLPTLPPLVLVGSATNVVASVQTVLSRRRDVYVGNKAVDISWCAWLPQDAAGRLVHALCGRHGGPLLKLSVKEAIVEVSALAARYDLRLAPHEATLARVAASVGKIAEKVDGANSSGAMAGFNAEFRRRRIAAQKSGARFMSYGMATARLKRALAGHAPGAAGVPHDLIAKVFGEE
jgi:hypothetical protein